MIGLVDERLCKPGTPIPAGQSSTAFCGRSPRPKHSRGITDDKPIHVVVDLDVPREIVLERLSSRRVCRDCGTNYTALIADDRRMWICDVCGGDVEHRADDTPDAVNRRLDLYESQTAPLITHYSKMGLLSVVNGVGHPDHVFKRVVRRGRRTPLTRLRTTSLTSSAPAPAPHGDCVVGHGSVALVAFTIALWTPSPTLVRERDRDLRSRPPVAFGVFARRQRTDDATNGGCLFRSVLASVRRSSATTSLTPSRPPGGATRCISANTAGLSVERLMTQLEMITSIDCVRERDRFDWPFRNVTLVAAGLGCVAAGEVEHLVGHVEPVDVPGRPDASGRQQHVDPAAGAEVEHDFTGVEIGDGDRVAAAEAGERRLLG